MLAEIVVGDVGERIYFPGYLVQFSRFDMGGNECGTSAERFIIEQCPDVLYVTVLPEQIEIFNYAFLICTEPAGEPDERLSADLKPGLNRIA
jgi:hypothetical protein